MATGSITMDPPTVPITGQAAQILIAKYDRTKSSGGRYTILPNLFCERIEIREGAVPSSAQFSYLLDNTSTSSLFPAWMEQIWPLGLSSPYVVNLGDELVVFAIDVNGNAKIIWDGFADAPQVNVGPKSQQITFAGSGVAIRCWDQPIKGSLYRDATDPQAGAVVATDLRCRFNPNGKPNATPYGYDVNQGTSGAYPVFLDYRLNRSSDPRRLWTLGMFVRYLFGTRAADELNYVDDPGSNFTDADLQAITPTSGPGGTVDFTDTSTYTASDIIIDDLIAGERAWPEVMEKTLDRHGFGMRFVLDQTVPTNNSLPEPTNAVEIFRRDGLLEDPPKDLLYQLSGNAFDPAKTNVNTITLLRDAKNVANDFTLVPRPTRYEAGIILAPGFTISSTDGAGSSAISAFFASAIANASSDVRAKYRRFVADEAGDGHWDFTAAAWTTTAPIDLRPVFGTWNTGDPPTYVRRRRPGEDTLFATNGDLKPFRAEVAVSTDYTGPCPGVWDGHNGTWQSIGHNGWKQLDDRLGIEISVENPNAVKLPDVPVGSTQVIPGGVLRIVESLSVPDSQKPRFFFKLTCVFEGDKAFAAAAPRRAAASPVPFTVRRLIDSRDVYEEDDLHYSSFHNGSGTTSLTRNDALKAIAQAEAMRSKNEFPAVVASATIPYLSFAYSVGDRVRKLAGKEIDLRSNAGASAKESPRYPVIESLSYDFSGNVQATRIELSGRLV